MTNECVLLTETQPPIPFTIANATGIAKGAVLTMTDPDTAILASATNDVVAGIAASEKIADDGNVKLGVYRGGIFKGTASGSITTGDPIAIAGAGSLNYLYSVKGVVNLSGSVIIGNSFEDASDEETFRWELRPIAQSAQAGS